MDFSVSGKSAIVTGGGDAKGIGASLARALAESGASVMIADINASGAKAVARSLQAEGLTVASTVVDIGDPQSVGLLVDATVSAFGRLDIIVNNAAVMAHLSMGVELIDYPLEEWNLVMNVNLTGTMLCCTAAARQMIKQGGGGRIINISSGGAFQLKTPYSISKLGIVGLTVVLAEQLSRYGITVNSIAPGMVETPAGLGVVPPGSAAQDRFSQTLRPGKPSDLHGALLLLASSAGDWINGQTFNIDGGWIKRI